MRAFYEAFVGELGKTAARIAVVTTGLIVATAYALAGATGIFAGFAVVLSLALLRERLRARSPAQDAATPIGEGDRCEDEDASIVRTQQATIDALRLDIAQLANDDREWRQRMQMLDAERQGYVLRERALHDLMAMLAEEISREIMLGQRVLGTVMERYLGVARAAVSELHASDVQLAVVDIHGTGRRVINNSGIERRLLEDQRHPLIDMPVGPAKTVHLLDLPEPAASLRLVAVAEGKLDDSILRFLGSVISGYVFAFLVARSSAPVLGDA